MKVACQVCGDEFKTSHATKKFCSVKCTTEWHKEAYMREGNPRWKNAKQRVCEQCGVTFIGSDPTVHYCPEHRGAAGVRNGDWTGGKLTVTLTCMCCNKEFETTQSQARSGRKFCSQSCSNIIKNKNNKKKNTSLEQQVETWLKTQGVAYEPQAPINGITLADFLVGTTVIQCDGVYWHTLPGRHEHDKRQDKMLNSLGFTVIRVSDAELKNEPIGRVMKRKAWLATQHNQHCVSWR